MLRKTIITIAISAAIGGAVALAPVDASARGGGGGGHGGGGFRGRGIRVAGFRRRGFPIAAGLGFGGWGYYDSCIVWTGYNWVNVCY